MHLSQIGALEMLSLVVAVLDGASAMRVVFNAQALEEPNLGLREFYEPVPWVEMNRGDVRLKSMHDFKDAGFPLSRDDEPIGGRLEMGTRVLVVRAP